MEIVDAQIHTFDVDNERYPWHKGAEFEPRKHSTTPFTYEAALEAMAGAGVDAAILVIPGTYGNENGYLLEAAQRHPKRFGVIGRNSGQAPDLDDRLRTWRSQPNMLGLRVVVRTAAALERWESGDFQPLLEGAERYGIPVCLNHPSRLKDVAAIAERHPGLSIVLDHLGLPGPPTTPLGPATFEQVPVLLDMARFPNVSVKATGVTLLSAEPYPFRDVWGLIRRVVDAYGVERVMWGSDLTRLGGQSYDQVVGYLREIPGFSASNLEALYGANVRHILGWPQRA